MELGFYHFNSIKAKKKNTLYPYFALILLAFLHLAVLLINCFTILRMFIWKKNMLCTLSYVIKDLDFKQFCRRKLVSCHFSRVVKGNCKRDLSIS